MLGDPSTLPRKRSRPVGLLDLPTPLLEDILLWVADSEREVDALPLSGALDEPVPAFLGDAREPSSGGDSERGCTYWLTVLGTVACPDGIMPAYRTPPRTPSGVLTFHVWHRLLPVLTTCRALYRLGLSAVRGLVLGPGASSLTGVRSLRAFPFLRLVVVSSNLGCSGPGCMPNRLAAVPSECPTANTIRDESLLPEALRRLNLNGLAFRGQLLPSGLLASLYHGASAPCLKRLSLEGLEGGGLCLAKSLKVHAPTLVELSLMLPLRAHFFRDALRPSSASPRAVFFPALRRLGLLVTHPPDVAVMVRAAPALTGIRLATSVTWESHCGPDWMISDYTRPAAMLLGASLASTAGRGLTSLELTGQDFSSPGFSAPSVVDFLMTHAVTLRSLRISSAWGRQWETTMFPPLSFGQLSQLVLGLTDFTADDLGPLLDRLLGAQALFPALVELRLAVEVRGLSSGVSRSVRCRLNTTPSDNCGEWTLGPSGLRRAHLRGPLPMLEAVIQTASSPSLVALALEGDRCPFSSPSLRTQVVAGLTSRCPALRAVRLDRLTISGRLVELLDLQGIRGLFGKCALWPRWPRPEEQTMRHGFHDCHSLEAEWELPRL